VGFLARKASDSGVGAMVKNGSCARDEIKDWGGQLVVVTEMDTGFTIEGQLREALKVPSHVSGGSHMRPWLPQSTRQVGV
jgi:hypothetical protein